jgi:hypothetical protein
MGRITEIKSKGKSFTFTLLIFTAVNQEDRFETVRATYGRRK